MRTRSPLASFGAWAAAAAPPRRTRRRSAGLGGLRADEADPRHLCALFVELGEGSGIDAGPHWSAEFHRGPLHRVETPHVRLVADCAAGTGTLLQVDRTETESGARVARAACGINSDLPAARPRMARPQEPPCRSGRDPRILRSDRRASLCGRRHRDTGRLRDFPRDPAAGYCVQQEPLALERRLPATDIFSPRSLGRSFAAEQFGARPRPRSATFGWGSGAASDPGGASSWPTPARHGRSFEHASSARCRRLTPRPGRQRRPWQRRTDDPDEAMLLSAWLTRSSPSGCWSTIASSSRCSPGRDRRRLGRAADHGRAAARHSLSRHRHRDRDEERQAGEPDPAGRGRS